ncbi:Subtilisin-like serine protease [Halalkaliarchaeum sp. AArc-CO]|uniref:S8 family serine peptidase n=1 Tax=Halalkaliarchaeum sp. AArc-CO TaxID=2866381 RepID=UPI00217EA30E|nr:S8 family serine peptidase [Halalkaliarchaeum sp. AArc-CO]UWG52051.1 Subtilisin-like serine protease [Halalkaliarchaeum sp. AArc-CO]
MTDTNHTESDDDDVLPVSRRSVLRTAGAAGAVGAIGSQPAAAARPKRRIVGVQPGRAGIVNRGLPADRTIKTLDFGRIGQAIVGRWPDQALRGLQRNPNVRYVEDDRTIWPEGHGGADLDWGADRIDAEIAHEAGHTGAGVSVAIVDSGIDLRHDELVDTLHHSLHFAPNVCDSGDCPEDWHDDNGHGTLVAGIVAASHDTGNRPIGVAPEATLHAVKVWAGATEEGFSSDLAEGIKWVADNDIDIANMSLGSSHSQTVEDAMEYATARDVVLISSAGNERGGDVTFPGGYPQDVGVSGITELDELSTISSTGPEVDIGAPTAPAPGSPQDGRGVLTTRLNGGTHRTGGTSSAAPHVAGAAALLLANGTPPGDVQDVLESTAEDLGLDAQEQGAGLVDVANALGLDSANDLLEVETRGTGARRHEHASLIGRVNHLVGSDTAEVFFEFRIQGTSGWERTDGEEISPDEPIAPILGNEELFGQIAEDLEPDTRYDFRAAATVTEDAEGWESTEHGERLVVTTLGYPTAAFEVANDPPVNEGDTVIFDASASEAPTDRHTGQPREIKEYKWDFGDGTTETTDEPTIEHSYGPVGEGNYGTFDVTLTVTDKDDGSDEELSVTEQEIRINAYPIAEFDVLVDPPEQPAVRGEPVAFDASASFDPDGEIDEYEWDFGDGIVETSDEPTIEHTYDEGGLMTVTLTVTDDDGAAHEERSVHREDVTVHIRVSIDVKPSENGTNPVNLRDETIIPVAVLHTADFDSPAALDPDTVRFGAPPTIDTGDGAAPIHDGGHVDDVNDSGDEDWHCHFATGDTGFDRDDDEAKLAGETDDGTPVFGFDDVRIVGGGRS